MIGVGSDENVCIVVEYPNLSHHFTKSLEMLASKQNSMASVEWRGRYSLLLDGIIWLSFSAHDASRAAFCVLQIIF